jgi:hypothetical protein
VNFKEILEGEKKRLESLIPEAGTSIKYIKGKPYLYKQTWDGFKRTCKSLGRATDEQADTKALREKLRLMNWLLENEQMYIEGLKILGELKNRDKI